jgi:hypothetical protein
MQTARTQRTMGERWSPCRWCGLWLREKREIEERESEPQADEIASPARHNSQAGRETPVSATELAICRRRGHITRIGQGGRSVASVVFG